MQFKNIKGPVGIFLSGVLYASLITTAMKTLTSLRLPLTNPTASVKTTYV